MPYTFAQDRDSQEIWAAKTDHAGRVVAIAGPLAATDISDSRLPDYPYRTDREALQDFNSHGEQFRWGLLPDSAEPA